MQAYGYIYITTNMINGKKYIGQRSYGRKRIKNYLGSGKYLKLAIAKYGADHFINEVICNCLTKEDLSYMETYFIAEYNAVEDPMFYNIAAGGYCTRGFTGKSHSDEYKQKMAEYGRLRPVTENMMAAFGQNKGGFSYTEKHYNAITKLGKLTKGTKYYNDGTKQYKLFPDDKMIKQLNLTLGGLKRPRNSNNTYHVTSPDHISYIVCNLSTFCKEHNLDYSSMLKLSKNFIKSYKHWYCSIAQ